MGLALRLSKWLSYRNGFSKANLLWQPTDHWPFLTNKNCLKFTLNYTDMKLLCCMKVWVQGCAMTSSEMILQLKIMFKVLLLFLPAAGHRSQLEPLIFNELCALKDEPGPCKAIKERFFFNVNTGGCELFEYGGCGGNDNNFETRGECEESCIVSGEPDPLTHRFTKSLQSFG